MQTHRDADLRSSCRGGQCNLVSSTVLTSLLFLALPSPLNNISQHCMFLLCWGGCLLGCPTHTIECGQEDDPQEQHAGALHTQMSLACEWQRGHSILPWLGWACPSEFVGVTWLLVQPHAHTSDGAEDYVLTSPIGLGGEQGHLLRVQQTPPWAGEVCRRSELPLRRVCYC